MARKFKEYKQGIFTPHNKEKYIGDFAIYRSSWELKFFQMCDDNPNVLKWGSESIKIPYYSPLTNKTHQYYIDNFVIMKEEKGLAKYLIEIKPSKQLEPPKPSNRKKPKTMLYEKTNYIKNQLKWKAAKEFCDANGFKFLILTEKELGIKV